ncbi:MAG: hypothetical protein LIP09_01585 [Bacteroidales bacterium]|nr:hypothetical protein [Bacteroidales bacterium]
MTTDRILSYICSVGTAIGAFMAIISPIPFWIAWICWGIAYIAIIIYCILKWNDHNIPDRRRSVLIFIGYSLCLALMVWLTCLVKPIG